MLTIALALWTIAAFVVLRIRMPNPAPAPAETPVSVVVPMRNEAANAAACLAALRAALGPGDELVVVDDHSTDGTGDILRGHGVAPVAPGPLPVGWHGKNWACWNGAQAAKNPVLLFVDADVRVAPGALRMAAGGCAAGQWMSEFPRQALPTWGERLALGPLFAAALVSRLPGMRRRAACGQWFAVRRDAYFAAGGHEAVRGEVSEDMALAAHLDRRGCAGRLYFGRGWSEARMYPGGAAAVWQGWTKNLAAGAAMSPAASAALFFAVTALFSSPSFLALALAWGDPRQIAWGAFLTATAALGFRDAVRPLYKMPLWMAPLYPVFVGFFLAALGRSLLARAGLASPASWKGRPV